MTEQGTTLPVEGRDPRPVEIPRQQEKGYRFLYNIEVIQCGDYCKKQHNSVNSSQNPNLYAEPCNFPISS